MVEENATKSVAAAPAEALPGSERPDYRGRCLYKTGKCLKERALKTSGAAHNLCDEHRSRQNEHQRKLDAKNRITKKERRVSTGSTGKTASAAVDAGAGATHTVTSRTRSPRYAPYPAPAGATAAAKRRSLPAGSIASGFTGAVVEAAAAGSPEGPISGASASTVATAATIAQLAPSAGVSTAGLQGLATSSTATSVMVAGNGSSGGMLYLPNGPQPPQLSYPCVMQDFDGIVVPLPSYLTGQERVEFRSRIYQKVLDFISEECILRFGAKVEASPATHLSAQSTVESESQSQLQSQLETAGSERLQSKNAPDASVPVETRASQSSTKPRATAGPTANL